MAVNEKPKAAPGASGPARDMKASRVAVGLNVIISIVAAGAVLVIANYASSQHYARRDMELLGSYRLSDTAKRILDQVDVPVTLTSIYTSGDPDKKPEQYLPRLRDLLEEIHSYRKSVEVRNIVNDRQKGELVERLRKRLDASAVEARGLVDRFLGYADPQGRQFAQLAEEWKDYPADGWLNLYGVAKVIETELKSARQETQELAIRQGQTGAQTLPNYSAIVADIKKAVGNNRNLLEGIRLTLRRYAEAPKRAQEADFPKRAQAVCDAAQKVVDIAGGATTAPSTAPTTAPVTPRATLTEVAAALRKLAETCEAARRPLTDFQEQGYAPAGHGWSDENGTLDEKYLGLGIGTARFAQQLDQVLRRSDLKEDDLPVLLASVRKALPDLLTAAKQRQASVREMVDALTQVDAKTAAILARAGKDDYLQADIQASAELYKAIDENKKLAQGQGGDQGELTSQITEENIVLVEVGDKTGVVRFDDVWPLANQSEMLRVASPEEMKRRVFYGDMAIASKILSLASEPFAEVVITYFGQPSYRGEMDTGPIPADSLRKLRERLKQANLKVSEGSRGPEGPDMAGSPTVTDWNLATQEEPPSDKTDAGAKPLKKVLLVLPVVGLGGDDQEPPPGMPPGEFGRQQRERLRRQIDAGTPAIFLAKDMMDIRRNPMTGQIMFSQLPYAFAKYLREDWGLDVQTGMRVVQCEPDAVNPGTYKLPVLRWSYLPLSSFTDHPVGKPLQARRLYWLDVCPVFKAGEGKPDVDYQDILTVSNRDDTWATAHADELVQKVFEKTASGLRPDKDAGDKSPPFAVVMEADRTGPGSLARIIVMGIGHSFIDDYVNQPVPRLEGEMLLRDPAPTGDLDLVVNAVYHLVDRDQYIGAGPAVSKPIGLIAPSTLTAVKIGFCAGLPALVLAIGVAVVIVRRRG